MAATTTSFKGTLERFLQSEDFSTGVVSSTKASWGGSGYSVELFPGGDWRVLWNNEIGNLYNTPGIILKLPTLDDSDYHDAMNGEGSYSVPVEEDEWFFWQMDAEKEDIMQSLRDELSDRETMNVMWGGE